MSDFFVSLTAALVGAVTGIGTKFFGDYYLGRIKEDRSKRLEIAIRRADEQIGKLYAPLLNQVEQLNTIAALKDNLVGDDPDNKDRISKFMYERYFSPIHDKIAETIEKNSHLIEGDEIPKSFIDYNEHVASERVYFSMEAEADKDYFKINFHPHPFPSEFYWDIKHGLDACAARQERIFGILDKEFTDEGQVSPSFQFVSKKQIAAN